jgi:hypothetical protein
MNMKLYKIFTLMLGAALLTVSCNDIDEQAPEGNYLTKDQVQETNVAVPSRTQATFAGMFNIMAKPKGAYPTSSRADDFGFVMAAISLDAEGADFFLQDNNYNWFSVCGEWSNRNPNYANPTIRYKIPYTLIGLANEFIASLPKESDDPTIKNQIAQARVCRAFGYMALAPYFQFGYAVAKDKPCVPLLLDDTDFTNNPRATVGEVWDYIITELTAAINDLAGATRTSKAYIDQQVAYGLRARANLAIGKYAEAAADAAQAMQGYTPASMEEVSVPAFCKLDEHNWIWGINVSQEMVQSNGYPTSSSWICAFCGDGYAPATENTPCINILLYDKIPATDVRKGWWIDENLHSPNWANLTWVDPGDASVTATGDAIATFTTSDGGKAAFQPYTNIKFGMKSGVGSTVNNNDWPLMRVEEMILIQAEGLAKSGNEAQAKSILENFVKTYRDPSYDINGRNLSLADEIWFQRRVELWGEGFFMSDAKRLNKPVVRFHGEGTTNEPAAFAFNVAADDPYMNMRFPQAETNYNLGIIPNEQTGTQPEAGQNPNLRDGVTD